MNPIHYAVRFSLLCNNRVLWIHEVTKRLESGQTTMYNYWTNKKISTYTVSCNLPWDVTSMELDSWLYPEAWLCWCVVRWWWLSGGTCGCSAVARNCWESGSWWWGACVSCSTPSCKMVLPTPVCINQIMVMKPAEMAHNVKPFKVKAPETISYNVHNVNHYDVTLQSPSTKVCSRFCILADWVTLPPPPSERGSKLHYWATIVDGKQNRKTIAYLQQDLLYAVWHQATLCVY